MRLFNKLVIFSLSVVVVLSGINVYAAPEDVWYSDVMETANKIGIINADEQPEETISNADFIKLAVEEGCGAYYIQNNSVNYDVNLDKVTIKSFENIDEDTLIFYTTETIDDLLNSYKKHSEIDLREVQGPVLKKTKKTNI